VFHESAGIYLVFANKTAMLAQLSRQILMNYSQITPVEHAITYINNQPGSDSAPARLSSAAILENS